MALHHPLPDEIVELIARRFRVIGDPTRIRLLEQENEVLRRATAYLSQANLPGK